MRQSYLKNAALMTGADVLLRLAGMGLRIWLANALGGEGMGLYQLVLAVYSLFVTLATAGVSVAATRLMAEELARSPAEARGMLHCLLLAGAGLGVLALAENAIGPDAMQPGTVATACNGTTVEINNTDAEGRLVLADAIAWASQRYPQARYIIDMATLTGAVVKALGYELSGLMTQDEPLRAALTQAGKRSGDEVWSLPLDARLKKQTDSAIADLCNTPTNNAAISASAAWLLHHFCPPAIPWAHLDISGTALWRENGRSVASGRPIPLLVEHLMGDL